MIDYFSILYLNCGGNSHIWVTQLFVRRPLEWAWDNLGRTRKNLCLAFCTLVLGFNGGNFSFISCRVS